MFAVFVDFRIKPGMIDTFLPLMKDNAVTSVEEEPGCQRFDVVLSGDDPNLVLLYEIYDNPDAFAAHMKTVHFLSFDEAVADMIADKVVRTGFVN